MSRKRVVDIKEEKLTSTDRKPIRIVGVLTKITLAPKHKKKSKPAPKK